jgi:hypothetical protein
MAVKREKTFAEKVQEIDGAFTSEVDGMSVQQLEGRLSMYAKAAQVNSEAQEADDDLKQLKAEAKEAGAPYRDLSKALKMKNKYIVQLIRAKGGNV